MWSKFLALQTDHSMPWCCVGDFNEMLAHYEKEGLMPFDQARADLFRQFLSDSGLMDLELKGCNKFTWASNLRNGVVTKEKLDRVVVNWPWKTCFPHAMATALPIVNSDHSLIILQPCPPNKSGRSFKYEAFCEEHPECKEVIQQGWIINIENDDPWKAFLAKTKSYKKSL